MIRSILLLPLTVVFAALSSCTPPPPPIPPGAVDPGLNQPTVLNPDQQAIEERRRQVAEEARKRKEAEEKRAQELADQANPTTDDLPKPPPVAPATKKWPYATPVPGNEGFVYSPYNNKVIDVRTIASGTLVKDPDDPAGSQNFFHVP